jgi:endonuclease YncB( thermonuclease family)
MAFIRKMRKLGVLIVALLPAFSTAAPAQRAAGGSGGKSVNIPNFKISGKAVVVEGDLLSVDAKPIRLMGIDAPDPGQKCKTKYDKEFDCFAIAVAVLRNLVEDADVECVVGDKDRNGMNQGECKVRGVDLGSAMVSRGWAFAYRSLSGAYASSEAYAQTHRFGMWAGKVEKPWAWRSRQLREQAK